VIQNLIRSTRLHRHRQRVCYFISEIHSTIVSWYCLLI